MRVMRVMRRMRRYRSPINYLVVHVDYIAEKSNGSKHRTEQTGQQIALNLRCLLLCYLFYRWKVSDFERTGVQAAAVLLDILRPFRVFEDIVRYCEELVRPDIVRYF